MGGDYSRRSFDPLRDFSGVGMQQGHLVTDADRNEMVAIFERRIRTGTVDTIGRAVVPKETPEGFEIRPAAGPKLSIGAGRMYVDGHLVQNHGGIGTGTAKPVLDRARLEPDGTQTGVLDEMISTQPNDFVDYAAQPYLPKPPALPTTPGPHIAYLDVWQREVTAVHDPSLLEPALGGADTATRWQTVWQVRLLENAGAGATCGSQSDKWDALIAPSPARLTTGTMVVEDPDDPCVILPGGGYRGLENHLYRVEIHTGGVAGAASFKWSRDNGSVATRIVSFEPGNRVKVRSLGPDTTRQFAIGDWVEITDNHREYDGQSGDMRRILGFGGADEIELSSAPSADLIPAAPDSTDARATRIVRWDGNGKVRLADGSLHVDLDATTDGLIPVPTGGKAVQLEAGITVSFKTEPAGGTLRALDHWSFAARTEGAQIEILDSEPPVIQHHYARLAVLTFPSKVSDCRIFWPSAECGCTVCVSSEAHNSGRLTIQAAIDKLPESGGTVCLGPGVFILGDSPVVIADRYSVRLRGHGAGSHIAYAGSGGALRVSNSVDIRITDLAVLVAPVATGEPGARQSSAIHLRDCLSVTVSRTRLTLPEGGESSDFGIALEGWVIQTGIEDNDIEAPTAIGVLAALRGPGPAGTISPFNRFDLCILYMLRVADNRLVAGRYGIALEGFVFYLGIVHVERNLIQGRVAGIRVNGLGYKSSPSGGAAGNYYLSDGCVSIRGNAITLLENADGIVSGVPDLRLLDNSINGSMVTQGRSGGTCIRLVPNVIPGERLDGQIVGNTLGSVEGYALSVETPQAALLVKRNLIRNCETGGIVMKYGGSIRTLSLDNNVIEQVGTVRKGQVEMIAGVALNVVTEARILGNTIRGVGERTTGTLYCAGLELQGNAAVIELSHNLIADIAPEGPGAAIGVLVHGPLHTCSITANTIFDNRAPAHAQANWCGIFVASNLLLTLNPPGRSNLLSTLVGNQFSRDFLLNAFSFTTGTAVAIGTATTTATAATNIPVFVPREPQVRISGNFVSAAQIGPKLPLVRVGTDMVLGSSCFTDNQCTLRTAGAMNAVVDLAAARLIVSNNAVRRAGSDALAMKLACKASSHQKQNNVTIIGNVTSGGINLNGSTTLPAAFIPLNVMSN